MIENGKPEIGQGQASDDKYPGRIIGQRVLPDRRQDTHWNGDQCAQQQAHHGQICGDGIAALEFLNDRLARPVGIPKVQPHRSPEPLPILHDEGLVEPEVLL